MKNIYRTGLLTVLFLTAALQVQAAKPKAPQIKKDTLTLISFNDFHGNFMEEATVPGASRLCATVKQMRRQNPDMLVLAGGDNFSGGYFPRLTGGKPLDVLFEEMKVDYSAIGNHEFDWGIPALVERMNWGGTRYLVANIFTDESCTTRPDWATPYAIHRMKLKNGTPIRIAVIGLATPETKTTAMPEIVAGLYFANPIAIAGKVRAQLEDSADIYILLTHCGTDMKDGRIVFIEPSEKISLVDGIDGIFTGHSHKEVCGTSNGTPVIQARNYGRLLGRMRFEVSRNKDGIVETEFLDMKLLPVGNVHDETMDEVLQQYIEDSTLGLSEPVCKNRELLDPDKFEEGTKFTALGSLITQAFCHCYKNSAEGVNPKEPVIGICNKGCIRTVMPKGEVTRLQAGNILPFGGVINAFRMNGEELMQLLQYGIDCKVGWMQYHDMEIEVRDGKVVNAWYTGGETKEDGTSADSVQIVPDGSYVVVTEHFLSSGGDGYNAALFHTPVPEFEKVPAEQRNPTDVFIDYLRLLRDINPQTAHLPKLK